MTIKKTWQTLLFAFLLLFSFQTTEAQTSQNTKLNNIDRNFEILKNLDIFASLFKEVNSLYVDEVNPNKLMKTGIDAMLKTLDPYTNYISEEQIEDYRTMTTGKYSGIGASVGQRNGKTTVIMPYDGSPAKEAGLQIGDHILKIDDIETKDKKTDDVSKLLKGQEGTEVKLTIQRYGETKPRELTFKRATIKIPNVPYYDMVSEDVGYLQLTDFTQQAGKEVGDAVKALKEKGAKNIIIDLRGNPGGLLHEAVNICNLFIDRGLPVVTTKGKVEQWNRTYEANSEPMDKEIPLVVLVNGRSASASEIVSGVLQDYDRAVLIGQNSFGKGLVQITRPISYNAQVKVTTAKYYIPSGRCIQALDYSNRDKNGKVHKVPDSLRTEFKTINNARVFKDGAGLEPDIKIEKLKMATIAKTLNDKNLIFEYANEYYTKHEKITEAKDFKLTEAEYQAFVTWLKNKDYNYKTQVEESLEKLKETAKDEKYYESLKTQIATLEKQLAQRKVADLQNFKQEIKELLEVEIVARYYFEKGKRELSFRYDKEVARAIKLFKNKAEYDKILAGE